MNKLSSLFSFLFSAIAIIAFAAPSPAQLMPKADQDRLDKAAPTLANQNADDALHGRTPGRRLFYTSELIEHASQDHSGNAVGFYLSAHNRSANPDRTGTDFEFPWKEPGGTEAGMVYAWKVMFLPGDSKVQVHRTYLKSFFAGASGNVFFGGGQTGNVLGYDWEFPVGTRFFELLSFTDRLSVFEVRSRTKTDKGWRSLVYRPFPTRREFLEAVDGLSLTTNAKLFKLSDSSIHRNKTAFKDELTMDRIPGFDSAKDADEAIRRPFRPTFGRDWTWEVGAVPWSDSKTAIVPQNYNGAFAGNDQQACQRCHENAATHVRFFDHRREWYGFVRGSKTEQILSFHPIDPRTISRNGGHITPRLNPALVDAGLVAWRKDTAPQTSMAKSTTVEPKPTKIQNCNLDAGACNKLKELERPAPPVQPATKPTTGMPCPT